MSNHEKAKFCQRCGRHFQWRRKWARNWEQVKFCSQRCRSSRLGPLDQELERQILCLLRQRKANATICPSQAARAVYGEMEWKTQMERTREAARRLAARGEIEITQGGRIVDGSTAKGPIRLRLLRKSAESSTLKGRSGSHPAARC